MGTQGGSGFTSLFHHCHWPAQETRQAYRPARRGHPTTSSDLEEPGRDCPGKEGMPPLGMPRQNLGLVLEQPALAVESAAIASQSAIGADHAMTGHDDRNRVPAVRSANGPARSRLANPPGKFSIRDGTAVRNGAQFMPDTLLKRGAREPHGEFEAFKFALEVGG